MGTQQLDSTERSSELEIVSTLNFADWAWRFERRHLFKASFGGIKLLCELVDMADKVVGRFQFWAESGPVHPDETGWFDWFCLIAASCTSFAATVTPPSLPPPPPPA